MADKVKYSIKTGATKGSRIAVEVLVAGAIVKVLAGQGLEITEGFEASLIVVLTAAIEMARNYAKTKGMIPKWLEKFV